jgi:predicted enzyme related to lactoylglutathione lyase
MKFTEIAFVAYPVTDMARARKFYEGILGLKPTMVMDDDKFKWVEYDIGSGTLGLGQSDMMPKPTADGASAALEVADFDETVKALKAKGVKFSMEPMECGDNPDHKMAIINDPDGSCLLLHRKGK